MHNGPKPKIVRVVTASYVVPWHLHNSLKRMPADFEVTVVGHSVSSHKNGYDDITWVDIDLNRKMSLIADLYSLWALCRFFRTFRPDVVHSVMPKAGLISALAGFICRVPIRVHTFTGQIWVNRRPVARFFLYWLDRMINALNTVCLTDSPSQSAFLHQNGISSHGHPLPVLGRGSLSGVEPERFTLAGHEARAGQLRDQLGIAKDNFVFTFIARKSRDKGAIDMLTAFSLVANLHPEARLLFVGPDESAGELFAMKAATPALFKNVIDVGQVDNHELYLSISDVLCLPSYREGFGSIVIDAAAAAVPTIGSNIVGLVDSIEDNATGILFSAGNMHEFAQAMRLLIEDPQRCAEMGMAARHRVEAHFTADEMYALLKNFYFAQLATKARG